MMSKALRIFLLVCPLASHAADEVAPPRPGLSEAQALCLSLDSRLVQSARVLAAQLEASPGTHEERAILIERWQKEQEPLQKQLGAARAALATLTKSETRAHSPEPASSSPATETSDPLLADIREIESGINAFHRSLASENLTPEQRAIQIEQFQELNREVLAEFTTLRRQVAIRDAAAANTTADSGTTAAEGQPDPSSPSANIKSELDRVMRDLSQVDPETRARYLEEHGADLDRLSREQARVDIQSSGEPKPETTTLNSIPTTHSP